MGDNVGAGMFATTSLLCFPKDIKMREDTVKSMTNCSVVELFFSHYANKDDAAVSKVGYFSSAILLLIFLKIKS